MSKYFRGLPRHQSNVFEQIAIEQDWSHHPKTLEALERKGLIVKREATVYGKSNSPIDRIPMTVYRYEVPLPIHYEWCNWCASQPSEEEQ